MNRHPVDRMAEIKAEIAALENEFAELREQVIDGQVESTGAEWTAVVVSRSRRSIVVAEAQRVLPPELFAALVRTEQKTAVMLYRLADKKKPRASPKRPRRRKAA